MLTLFAAKHRLLFTDATTDPLQATELGEDTVAARLKEKPAVLAIVASAVG